MSTLTKKMTKNEMLQLYQKVSPYILKEAKPAYTLYQVKLDSCSITAYESGKVVFQGKDLSWLEAEQEETKKQPSKEQFPQAGSDEVGTGDYFGPVVVSACIVEAEHVDFLRKLGIQDSKAIDDVKIRQMAPKIKSVCKYSILIVSNEKYNIVHENHNMVDMKCQLHNQAYVNLLHKGYSLPSFIVIDQFVQEKSYYRYLAQKREVVRNIHFETKAENKYLAVACASVLARNAFLETWDSMEEKYDFHFEKGAGKKVDTCAKEFVQKFGFEELGKVAKLHFANTKKIG
ncbi:MAG: ribonuclease HIII [Bacillota bacterium]|nr:ribonuclease HIII [Bacillota bacterium]